MYQDPRTQTEYENLILKDFGTAALNYFKRGDHRLGSAETFYTTTHAQMAQLESNIAEILPLLKLIKKSIWGIDISNTFENRFTHWMSMNLESRYKEGDWMNHSYQACLHCLRLMEAQITVVYYAASLGQTHTMQALMNCERFDGQPSVRRAIGERNVEALNLILTYMPDPEACIEQSLGHILSTSREEKLENSPVFLTLLARPLSKPRLLRVLNDLVGRPYSLFLLMYIIEHYKLNDDELRYLAQNARASRDSGTRDYFEKVGFRLFCRDVLNAYSHQEPSFLLCISFHRNQGIFIAPGRFNSNAFYDYLVTLVNAEPTLELKLAKLHDCRRILIYDLDKLEVKFGHSNKPYENPACIKITQWIADVEREIAMRRLDSAVGTSKPTFFGYAKDYTLGTVTKPAIYETSQAQTKTFEPHRI